MTRQKIHGLAEPLEESPDIMTVPSVPVLEDEFDNTLPTPSGENSRKRRKISSWLCDLPPIERYASEAEESEGADSDDDKSKNNQGR